MKDMDRILREKLHKAIELRRVYERDLRNPTFRCPRYRYEDEKRIGELTREIDEISARLGDRD
tara:strand:+ start:258 stop:446 length:189 start_codon:yes stop_codon:yes gene_type:complete